MIQSGITVTKTVQIKSENMILSDPLSRGVTPEELGIDPNIVVDLIDIPLFVDLIEMMNPITCKAECDMGTNHIQTRWIAANLLVQNLFAHHN